MALDPVNNLAKVQLSTGYTAGATSVVLAVGQGAKLPQPSTDGEFNLTWWNSTDYPDPADDPDVEIVRCTARSADTLTITRAQEGTSATGKNTAGKTYKMVLGLTKRTYYKLALREDVQLIGIISPTQITGNQNDYNPTGLSTASTLRLSTDASRNITGLAGGAAGRVILAMNVGSNPIVFKREDAGSAAANRFAADTDATLLADQSLLLIYDSTSSRWRIAQKDSNGEYRSQQKYEASGTWTKPAGLKRVKIRLQSGGGGGGGAASTGGGQASGAGGGCGGSYGEKTIPASTLGSTETVTVGAGGAGGAAGAANNGANGGTSSFGSHISAAGGGFGTGGAAQSNVSTGALGGTAGAVTGADFYVHGSAGGNGFCFASSGNQGLGGIGGGAHLGGGGRANPAGQGNNGELYGGGGAGGGAAQSDGSGKAGGSGAAGIVIVEEFF